ncbi:hypothetical protein QJU87_04135 [Pasteurella skyensis]|uniref:hypothetical protein n=1 Tax=Phocoenobacter skyensis TaxID=97481 RepID=UPI0027681053|nr:hypothetical protein [Pasteurella skyensis]MDP8189053.1 hypothetical protein [Pasteurella skyensis]
MKYSIFLNKTLKFILAVVLIIILVMIGQCSQYMASTQDSIMNTILLWDEHNPTKKNMSEKFIDECLMSKMVDKTKLDITKIDTTIKSEAIYECGNNLGLEDLIIDLKKTESSMTSLAFPLSIFNSLK